MFDSNVQECFTVEVLRCQLVLFKQVHFVDLNELEQLMILNEFDQHEIYLRSVALLKFLAIFSLHLLLQCHLGPVNVALAHFCCVCEATVL